MLQNLTLVDGSSSGDWITQYLRADLGRVSSHVPDCYQRYLRILHPAQRRDGRQATWREVASERDRRVHPLAQWHALIGASDPERISSRHWQGVSPEIGALPHGLFQSLCLCLLEWTPDSSVCFFGVWEGWSIGFSVSGPKDGGRLSQLTEGAARASENARAVTESDAKRLDLPHRSYVVLRGALESFAKNPGMLGAITPNLIWPADRSWFVATEIDFDSTLVAGSREMTTAILASDKFEAWEVSPQDSLTYRSDRINMQAHTVRKHHDP
jgi:hypothetical protein